jgi:hypothetical protein
MTLRHALTALLLVLAAPARATDYTDLWWTPSESGAGLTVTHQGNVVFLAFFVYGPDGKATWFSSPAAFAQSDSNGNPNYTGTLFQSTGPAFSGPFNPAAVNAAAVGTATFAVTSASTANLGYTVGGVSVSKSLVRQTFKLNTDVVGDYLAGRVVDNTSCTPAGGPFLVFEESLPVSISGTPAHMAISLGTDGACMVAGPYTAQGRLGRLVGSIVCTDARGGTATFEEIEANRSGFRAKYSFRFNTGCNESGRIAGARGLRSP